jgi:RNA polymerase sigma-70 factor (ECF subfamily)
MIPSAEPAGVNGEAAVVARARERDPAAFTELVNRYERRVFRLARHITQNVEDAEDVLQETFLRAYKHLPEFKGQSKFYTWLVRIAVNQALMKLRRRRTDRAVSLDETIDTGEENITREIAVWDNPEQRYSQVEIREILEKAVASLPPVFRTVFILRDIDELSTEETAAILNLSVPAVKTRLLRARLRLREKLTRYFRRKVEDVFAHL